MTRQARQVAEQAAPVAAAQAEEIQVAEVVETTAEVVETEEEEEAEEASSIFASILNEEASVEETRDDIIKRCLLDKQHFTRLKGLDVRNVVATARPTHTTLTFVVKQFVFGTVYDNNDLDAFGNPIAKLGRTHNVTTSTFAVAGVMKDHAKGAIFAADIAGMQAYLPDGMESAPIVGAANVANLLFAGGKIDVLCQHVPAGEKYVNPFASNAEPVIFEDDKIIHHVINLTFGEVGNDVYKARIFG